VIFLDTSFLIDYSRNPQLYEYILDEHDSVVSVISYHEIMTGLKRMRVKRELDFSDTCLKRLKSFHMIKRLQYVQAISRVD
jgi:predicted nucleic acid-binding protein